MGMIFFGFLDSSPYMAADSKPTQDQKAKNKPTPADPATTSALPSGPGTLPDRLWNALSGLSEPSDQPSGPPPQQYWYYCDSARGYYPYVSNCPEQWRAVPATPPASP